MAKKLTFIIPGFRQKPTSKAYRQVSRMLKKEGHHPVPVKIPWEKSTISDNTEYFLKAFKRKIQSQKAQKGVKKTYILGFSFGAMIAFIAATKVKVDGLILCSLSPYFKEDLPKQINKKLSTLEATRMSDFSQFGSKKLTKKIKTKKIIFLYGEKESKQLITRVRKTYRSIISKDKHLFPIQKTEHDLNNARYLKTIHHATTQFL